MMILRPLVLLAALVFVSSGIHAQTHPLDTLKPGEWFMVPNSRLSSVLPSPLPPGGGPGSITDAWSSGAYDTKRNRLIVTGGGHNDYGGNELYAFDVPALKWSRPWGPSPNDVIGPVAGPCREALPDGNPPSRHTYNGVQYLAGIDRLWLQGGNNWCGSGGLTVATWHHDFDARTWQRRADHPASYENQVAGVDPATGKVYTAAPGGGKVLHEFDPVTNTYRRLGTDLLPDGAMVGAVDPKRRQLVAFGVGRLVAFDLATGVMRTITPTGDLGIMGCFWCGFEYDPVADKFVAWGGGTDVSTLDPVTWRWTRVPAATTNTVTPSPPTQHGTMGRWRYMPRWNAYVLYNRIDDNVYFYRLTAGMPTPVPTPTPTPVPVPAPTPVPVPPPTGQIDIPPGVFVALAGPDGPPAGIPSHATKHVTWAHNPLNGPPDVR